MTREERYSIELPIKVPDEDTVYIFRGASEAEVKNILAGEESGKFWGSRDEFRGDYTIIAKSNPLKRLIRWAYVREHQEEFPRTVPDKERGGLKTVWEKNPDFTERATIYNNHFQEVGESRILKNIVVILDRNNNVIYLAPELAIKEPWQMTQKQFENVKKKPVDVAIDELEPTHALDIEPREPTTPKDVPIEVWQDIDTGKYLIEDGHNRVFHARKRGEKIIKAIVTPTKRIAEDEVVTAFDILHKNIVKQALKEGKPVPQEVLRDYPDLTKKLMTEHVS